MKPYKCSKCGGAEFYVHGKKRPARFCKSCTRAKNAAAQAEWRRANPGEAEEQNAKSRVKLRQDVIREYGGRCSCCHETGQQFLSIDHINGNGHLHRRELRGMSPYRWLRKNGYPKDNYRLLCYNCNLAKAFAGFCHVPEV